MKSFAISVILVLTCFGEAQDQPVPTLKNIAYGTDHKAQVLDVYQVDSSTPTPVMVYIHGGGWRGGTKNRIPRFLEKAYLEGWLSIVSVEYRFTDVESHPAQVNDSLRAIQFVKSKAETWNIDPLRLGVTGGSAGAHLSLWVALHDDVGDADAKDPVARESSRVSCAIGYAGPTDWSLLGKIKHVHPAYRQLLGYEPETPAAEMDPKKMSSVSPLTYASADDPPILIVHGDDDQIVPIQHAYILQKALKESGGNSELLVVKGGKHNVAGGGTTPIIERSLAFLKEHLEGEKNEDKKVVIVVGPEKHAPGTHEVAAGGRLMKYCLRNAENVSGIDAEVFYGWPEDRNVIDTASTVVFIGDQFPGERLGDSMRTMRDLEVMAARGCGIVCIHYATGLAVGDVTEDGDHPLLHWTGGYFATKCDHHQSVARIFEATITPAAPEDHPVLRGWQTFQVRDEPYTQNWFGKGGLSEGAIPLATVEFPPANPVTETVAWAIERKDGGRGAGITMPHFFRNWDREELRRFILNTIVWSTGENVPEGGVKTTLPALETFKPVAIVPNPRVKLIRSPIKKKVNEAVK